ncbi:hypothetical protein M8C13_36255 [Crossiella sp. SN42]|uniref:hypothetical protein n=1 Tax=Crossiella sp. SN42 TaxID=2944808 RepID=UPI00207CFFBC|nr:hypothetical protein [Crossiella sp. SN42]MCO1581217.1 hypothetical protein [Crossiella sp. SN42]
MSAPTAPAGAALPARMIARLGTTPPAVNASNLVHAQWYEDKARMLELLAEADPPRATIHRQRAATAREMAAEYRKAGDQS